MLSTLLLSKHSLSLFCLNHLIDKLVDINRNFQIIMTLLAFDLNLNQLRDRNDAGLLLLALLAVLVFLLFRRAGFWYFSNGDSVEKL